MRNILLFLSLLFSPYLFAVVHEMDINLSEHCDEEPKLKGKKLEACQYFNQLAELKTPPLEIKKKDSDGETWKIRFHFGFTRTRYANQDLHLNTSRLKVVVKDFEFEERTSDGFYDSHNWQKPEDSLRWIDEPTNTFNFSFEKGKNTIYLTMFHPKFLIKKDEVKDVSGTIDGVPVNGPIPLSSPYNGVAEPGKMYLGYFGNTYMQLDFQIGYGRQFTIHEGEKGVLTWTPRVDVGISTGLNQSSYAGDEYKDAFRYQGLNGAVGYKLEYRKGRLAVFLDQKLTYSHLKHGFLDGTAEYNMKYNQVTIGVGLDLYRSKKKIKK